MSYLTLTKGIPDFSKAVISLWFRVPEVSVKAAANNSLPTQSEDFTIMQGVLPLVTFGRQQKRSNYVPIYDSDIVSGGPPLPPFGQQVGWQLKSQTDVDPCCIGLNCQSDGKFDIVVNLQSENMGSYHNLLWFLTALTFIGASGGEAPGNGIVGNYATTIVNGTSPSDKTQAEYFRVESRIGFKPDQWHHLLLSFDISGSCSIGPKPKSDCLLWYAVDDVNYKGAENLRPLRDADDGLGPNNIVTNNTYNESGFVDEPVLFWNNWIPAPSGNCSPGPIPSNGAAFGSPASEAYVNAVFQVEMAEFQLYTGVTLDTEAETNRRAFVDAEGKPVSPDGTTRDPRGPGEILLGKKPDILLHGASNWKAGTNTGTTGQIIVGSVVIPIPDGQFKPTGGIEIFTPDPILEPKTPV